MQSEINVNVKQNDAARLSKGYPLISKEALVNENQLQKEGSVIRLLDEKNHFIAKGYYGRQNKGYGWVLTRKENEKIDQEFFNRKMKRAFDHRESFYKEKDTTAFRLFNGEGDGIGGLIIDQYDGYYVVSWYSKGIYQFKDYILNALTNTASVKAVYQKKRFDTKGQYIDEDDFVMGAEPAFPLIVKENGVNFAVHLNDGAMVGVFLDQRDVRKRIRDHYAKGKNVLNMFSYTGAFSIFSAVGGALKTTSVDLANRSLSKTIEQFSVNGIDHEAHDIIVEDVFKYFKYAIKKQLKFDLVILDPPSFAKSKKFTFSAAKDYKNLLKDTIEITEDNGVIVASTNSSAFDMKRFKSFIDMAFKESHINYKILEEFSLPGDFKTIDEYKEGNYLKVVFIKKLKI
ncbi:class I SAM-dependent rRNA methyltransferase [Bacillus sp. CECT 9360]|uniref:class I SAM-dependent rRNA methyltransferase n=1 Tax=Bacillus sp. CECT 9360 TaxID=2845821 RepID=UPI001E4DE600|nr:class I SAM-dependent rRNA methyltransferase [Bacillus sp. CECT 9360]CAH0344948.1 Ribosomal RNA large subunit methyltransferase I [Bacillus sp. CECT 9360]